MIFVDCFSIAGMTPEAYEILYVRASGERKAKADRYRRREDRLRCVAADALLRRALGRDDFDVIYHEYGKPAVAGAPGFHYNLSHSGDWVVIAYGDSPVGVDVERIDMNPSKEQLARRFFTPDECGYIFSGTGEGRGERFFRIWTAKESVLKYLGAGLSRSLDSFSVLEQAAYTVRELPLAPGYSLSLCAGQTEAQLAVLDLRQLTESAADR